jgi:serine/threonine protein kinase
MTSTGWSRRQAKDRLVGRATGGDKGAWTLVEALATTGHNPRSTVWRAHPPNEPSTTVAIKIGLHEAGEALVRREILRRGSLPPSRHVVEMLGTSEDVEGGPAWFVMPFAERGSLVDAFAGPERSLTDLLSFALQVNRGLIDAGVVHRDLNPSNVLVFEDASGGVKAAISDWSRSIVYGSKQPLWLEPESVEFAAPQISWETEVADARDDLFSIGAMIWWACTGTSPRGVEPRSGERVPVLQDIQTVPPQLSDLVTTLLQPNRANRAPGIEGNRPALRWAHERLEECLAEVCRAELAIGRPVLVGADASAEEALHGARSPAPVAPVHHRATRSVGTASVALLERGPALTPPPSRLRTQPRPSPPARREPARRERMPPDRAPAPTDPPRVDRPDTGRHRLSEPRPGRGLTRAGVLGLFAAHVLAGVLIFDPSSLLAGQLALLVSAVVAAAVAGLDLIIATDLRRGSSASLGGMSGIKLAPVRCVIAVLIALVTAQPLLMQLFAPEVDLHRTREARIASVEDTALRTALTEALARRQKLDSDYKKKRTELSRDTKAAAGGASQKVKRKTERSEATAKDTAKPDVRADGTATSGGTAGSGSESRTKKSATKKGDIAVQRRNAKTEYSRAVFASDQEISDARTALSASRRSAAAGISDGTALRRYLSSEPRSLVIGGLVVLLLLVIEGVPSVLALATRDRL